MFKKLGLVDYLMLILPPLLWSTMIIVGVLVVVEVPPAALTFWTWLAAVIGVLPFAWRDLSRNWKTVRREFGVLLVYAAVGGAAFQGFYYAGLERTTGINAALMGPVLPLFVACIAWMVLHERLTPTQILGVAIAFGGGIWISVGGDWTALAAFGLGTGELLIALAFVCMSFYTVMLRRTPSELSPITFMAVIATLSCVVTIPFFLWEAASGMHTLIPAKHAIAILYIGIVTYDLGYVFWNISVKRGGAGTTALFIYLIPVFGTVLAMVFLAEFLAFYHGVGIALIFAGIYLALHHQISSAEPVTQER